MGSLQDSSDQCFGRKQNHYQRWVNSLRRDCRKTAEKLASDRLPAASCHTSDTHRGTLQMRGNHQLSEAQNLHSTTSQKHRTIKTHKWSIFLESGVCIRNEVKAVPLPDNQLTYDPGHDWAVRTVVILSGDPTASRILHNINFSILVPSGRD